VDSLAGLLSEKESDDYDKGIQKGDQGQFSKKLKLFIKNFNRKIAEHDAFGILVTHAYSNQKFPLEGTSKWICSGGHGFQFFPSFSVMLEKAKMKDKTINGVRVKGEVTKTRFAPPFQKIELNVPYDDGIDEYEGLLEILVENKIIDKNGGWYKYHKDGKEVKFQEISLSKHIDNILDMIDQNDIENMELAEDKEDE
jgi:RecA/RadA recombinase